MKKAGSYAGAIAAAFQTEAVRARTERSGQGISYPDFLTSEDYCAPYFRESSTWPSPVVQAVAQASAGLAVTTIDEDTCRAVFHCGLDALPRQRRLTVVVGSGRGGGKTSTLLVPKGIHAAWTCPLPNVKRRQLPSVVFVCPEKEQAREAFNYALGVIESSPILREYLDHRATNKERIVLARPDGRRVEIRTIAAKVGGGALRSKTLIFVGLDESAFFRGEDYAVNDQDIYDAAKGSIVSRKIAGAQIWLVSSPWIEGEGLMEGFVERDWGKHDDALIAARVSTYLLKGEPDDGSYRAGYGADEEEAYRREILAIPLPKGSRQYFSGVALREACDRQPPACSPAERAGGVDLAHGRDSSAAAGADRYQAPDGPIFAAIGLREIRSAPSQRPSATYRELVALLIEHRITRYAADKHYKATLREATDDLGITFIDAPEYVLPWRAAREILNEGRLALGRLPEPQRQLLCAQLAAVVAVERPSNPGSIKIILPRSDGPRRTGGVSHCDSAAAFVLALWAVGSADRARWARVVDRPQVYRLRQAAPERRGPRATLRAYSRRGLAR